MIDVIKKVKKKKKKLKCFEFDFLEEVKKSREGDKSVAKHTLRV
jgi:hypothetical protein